MQWSIPTLEQRDAMNSVDDEIVFIYTDYYTRKTI